MICPKCKQEYREGYFVCADCGERLVWPPSHPASPPARDQRTGLERTEMVAVLVTSDPGLMAAAEAMLESASIAHWKHGEGLQSLFGLGRFPGGFSLIAGPMRLCVAEHDEKEARMILDDLLKGSPELRPPPIE